MDYRNKLIKYFRFKQFTTVKVELPSDFVNKIEIMCHLVLSSGQELRTLLTFTFALSFEILYDLFEKHLIRTLPEMLIVTKYIQNNLSEFLQCSKREFVFDQDAFIAIMEVCHDLNITPKEFFKYIEDNRFDILGEKIIITKDNVRRMKEAYEYTERRAI